MNRARLAAALASLALLWPAPSAADEHAARAPANDCAACHSCKSPTHDDPCVKACQRPKAAPRAAGPQMVVLDDLAQLYEPVRFDHARHSSMTRFQGDCTSCHHHTPRGGEHPACRKCHPIEVSRVNLEQPDLKGAYHRQCLGCHREWQGETSCEICHAKKGAGSAAHSLPAGHSPLEMRDVIVFRTGFAPSDSVPFHHRNHSARYENDCVVCHKDQGCTKCHVQGREPHPMGELAQVDLHQACFRCHRADATTSHPQGDCKSCHGRASADLFTHVQTGWPLKRYHEGLQCRACHPPWTTPAKLDPNCESCHAAGFDATTFDHTVTAVALDDVHRAADCKDCHAAGFGPGKSPSCAGCHDDGRVWDAKRGFGEPSAESE